MSHDVRAAKTSSASGARIPCPGGTGREPCVHALAERQLTLQQVRHELRTPLAALRSFLELAADGDLDEATTKQCIEAIDRNVERLSAVLDRIS